jgi:broad specificity phosphatase PhoE
MKLLIVRHAESMGNATGDYSSAISDSLSDRGKAQAESLAERLASWSFDRTLVSPLQRAMETVTPYLRAARQRAEIWPEIAEACWHPEREAPADSWGTQPAPLPSGLADLFFYRDNHAARPTHPESFGAGLRRVHDALALLEGLDRGRNGSLLMVTHGHFIRELLNLMLRRTTIEEFPQDNCGMRWVTFNGRWTAEFPNRRNARRQR